MTSQQPNLLEAIVAWARSDPNVLALVMTGSRARAGASPDGFADFDLEIIAEDVQALVRDDRWWRAFGEVWVYWFDEDPEEPTRLIVYENGQKVDFSLYGRERIHKQRENLDELYERGYRVLVDKERLTAELPKPTGAFPVRSLPTQDEFTAVVYEFWFEAFHIPRYLMRDELWVVKFRDWTMKEMLLKVLEWHAIASKPTDVWHIGLRMREWVDTKTGEEVGFIFGHFDAADSWRALIATMDLFRRVGRETATQLGLEYPEQTDAHITKYVLSFEERLGRS